MRPAAAFMPLLAAAATGAAADARLGGILELEAAVATHDGAAQKADFIVVPELEWRTPWGLDLTAIGRIRSDAYDRLEPERPDQAAVDPRARRELVGEHTELELRELYVDAYVGAGFLRIGKQQIVWGEADGLKVLDLVNPQSFREFILDEFEDSRIPLWSVKWEMPLGEVWNAQLLLIPDQTYHEVPEPGAVFAPTAAELVPRPDVPITGVDSRVPDDGLADADAGVQLSAWLDGWDVTLNYLYHYGDTPVLSLVHHDQGAVLRRDYRRTRTFGGTLANAFGDFTLRAEAGYSTDRHFVAEPDGTPQAADAVVAAGELSYVVGVDWMGLTDTLVSAQLFQSHADVHPAAVRRRVETDVTLLVERTWRNDTMKAGLLAIHDADDGDGVVTVELSHAWRSNVTLRLEASVFYGAADGRFGQFDDGDRVLLGVEVGL